MSDAHPIRPNALLVDQLFSFVRLSNSLGVSDYVEDGVNSLSVPVGDADALALRIRELWGDPQRASQMGAAGHAFAVAHCSEDSIISHLKMVLLDYGLPV